jgi:hypothetical protein
MEIVKVLSVLGAPIGILLGIIITKSFDLYNKKAEYELEREKILYTEKIRIGSNAVKSIEDCNNSYFELNILVTNADEVRENIVAEVFENTWRLLYENLETTMKEMRVSYNQIHFYYSIPKELEEEYAAINKDYYLVLNNLHSNINDDFPIPHIDILKTHRDVLVRYISVNRKLTNIIKEQSLN